MSGNDEYDDLDDLLGDFGAQNEVLSKPPGSAKDAVSNDANTVTQPKGEHETENKTNTIPKSEASSKDEPRAADISKLKLTDDDVQEDAFAQQLQTDVGDLLKEADGDPATQKLIETLIGSIQQTSNNEAKAAEPESKSTPASAPPSFEDTISATMNRLNESQRQGSEEPAGTDFMERMLRELQTGASSGEGGALDDLLSSIMSELSSKEVLYEPMKDMHTKFPEWLSTKGTEVSDADLKRYKQQQIIVAEIVETFEAPGYSDDNAEKRKFITAKMEEMQNTGAPPDELVADVGSGAFPGGGMPNLGGDNMPAMPGDCATQ